MREYDEPSGHRTRATGSRAPTRAVLPAATSEDTSTVGVPQPSMLLRLQKFAGNAATAGLISVRSAHPVTGSFPGTPRGLALQCVAPEAQEAHVARESLEAFELIAIWSPPVGQEASVPDIPASAPTAVRPPVSRLRRAKEIYYHCNMPRADDVVRGRLEGEGVVGMAKWLFYGPKLVLQEKLARAVAAEGQWRSVRPAWDGLVRRYGDAPGADTVVVDQHRRLIAQLDLQMTRLVPELHTRLLAHVSPEEAKLTLTIAQAERPVRVFGEMLATAKPLLSAVSVTKKGAAALEDGMPGGSRLKSAAGKYDAVKALLDGLKTAEDLDAIIGRITTAAEEGELGDRLRAGKDVTDASKVLTALVKDSGKAALDAVAWAYEVRAATLVDSGALPHVYAPVARRANGLRTASSILSKLDTPAAVLGIASGALGLVSGVTDNDAEAGIGGGLDVVEGVAKIALPAVALPVSIATMQLRGMLHVVGQMSRSLRAIHAREMKRTLQQFEKNLRAAQRGAATFDLAFGEWASLHTSSDPVDRALAGAYGQKISHGVEGLHNSIVTTLSSAHQGPLTKYPVLAEAFYDGFGGHGRVQAAFLDLAHHEWPSPPSVKHLVYHAYYFKTDILEPFAAAVAAVGVKVDETAAGTDSAMTFRKVRKNS